MLMGIELLNNNSTKTQKSINKIVFEEGKKHNIFFRTLGNVVMLVPALAISNKEINLLVDGAIKTVNGISKLLKRNHFLLLQLILILEKHVFVRVWLMH